MLELLELRFSGIGRFVDEQTVDITTLSGFTQVDGLNTNTGGSSGAAKSTVFNALDYLLGMNKIPATILQSRLVDEQMLVVGKFNWDGQETEVSRGKGGLKVTVGDKVFKGSHLGEEKIDEILGMPRDLFRKVIHKRQKEGGFFLDFTPKEMHDFLMDCLNMGEFKAKLEFTSKRAKDLAEAQARIFNEREKEKTGLEATQNAIIALGMAPVKEIHQEVILDLKSKAEKAEINLRTLLAAHSLAHSSLEQDRPKTKIEPFDRSTWDIHEKNRKELELSLGALFQADKDRMAEIRMKVSEKNNLRNQLLVRISDGKKAMNEAVTTAEEIKKIRASICPTCDQSWTNEAAQKREQELLAKLGRLGEIVKIGNDDQAEIPIIDNEILELKAQDQGKVHPDMPVLNEQIREEAEKILAEKAKEKEWSSQQNAVVQAENEKFASLQRSLRDEQAREADQYRGQLDITKRTFDMAVSKLKAYEDSRTRYEASLNSLKSQEENFTKKIEELSNQAKEVDSEIFLAIYADKAIQTYISYSFDDALDAIGNRATEIIRCIPNTSNATIQFKGTKETQDGDVKELVNAVIGSDGEESVPIKSLSGGERSSVDLAVDLAVIDFIETKSGKGMNLFILDEPFNGLGTVEIEQALEVLKNSNTNKKLIIVDHNPEVKQMVQDRLLVTRVGTTSTVSKVS